MVNNKFKANMPFSRKYYDCKIAKCIVKDAKLCVIFLIVSNLLIVITNYCAQQEKKLLIRRNILRSSIFYRVFVIRLDVI